MVQRGLVHIYTGNGKGKTTAALGLAMRAVGHGLRVIIFQFLKGSIAYGELRAAKKLWPLLEIVPCGRDCFVKRNEPDPEDVRLAKQGLERAERALTGEGNYDVVVLDEVNCAVDFGLLTVEDIIESIEKKQRDIEVVLTGRNAHPELIERADLVTEMVEVKHYYRRGIDGRLGIER